MNNASDIIDGLTVKEISRAVGVTDDAVRFARRQGKIPASWYGILCAMAGQSLPLDAFAFKGTSA